MALGLPDFERAIGLPCVSAAGKLSDPKSRPRFLLLAAPWSLEPTTSHLFGVKGCEPSGLRNYTVTQVLIFVNPFFSIHGLTARLGRWKSKQKPIWRPLAKNSLLHNFPAVAHSVAHLSAKAVQISPNRCTGT
jgi:hypothetical protein